MIGQYYSDYKTRTLPKPKILSCCCLQIVHMNADEQEERGLVLQVGGNANAGVKVYAVFVI